MIDWIISSLYLVVLMEGLYVADVPQPQLVVSSTVRGSVQLDCKTPYAGVSQCYFYPERDETNTKHSPSCQLSLTDSELTRWTGRSYSSPQSVNIICYYTVDEFRNQAESPHSLPATVTVLGKILINLY